VISVWPAIISTKVMPEPTDVGIFHHAFLAMAFLRQKQHSWEVIMADFVTPKSKKAIKYSAQNAMLHVIQLIASCDMPNLFATQIIIAQIACKLLANSWKIVKPR
jgi:hypothetical protein